MLGKIRTLNPQIRSLILYPIEPQARKEFFVLYKKQQMVSRMRNEFYETLPIELSFH